MELDSKRISIAKEEGVYKSNKDGKLEMITGAPNGIDTVSDTVKNGSAKNLNSGTEGARKTAQKANAVNAPAKLPEKDKQVNSMIASMPNHNTYSLNNQRQ